MSENEIVTPEEIVRTGRSALDVDVFQLNYTDMAAHEAEARLRAEFREREIYVGQGQRSLTWRYAPEALERMRFEAGAFFTQHEPDLVWWTAAYFGAQLWMLRNGLTHVGAAPYPLAPVLSGNRNLFPTLVALHHKDPGMAEAFAGARARLVAAAEELGGQTLYVNEAGQIDLR